MGRIRMVTRTITSTNAKVLMVNPDDRSTFEQIVPMPGEYKDNEKLMKEISALFSNEPVKPVTILSTEIATKLYGMTEQCFVANAEILPDRKN